MNNNSKSVLLYEADNFKVTDFERKSVDLKREAALMESGGVHKYLDKRHLILSTIDASSWDFYLNYLDICSVFARQYPNNKPSYLLELGYIPLIMLPSTNLELGPTLTALLDAQNVPYKATSKTGDGKIRIHVSANTFIPTVYMSGQEENPIDVLGVGYANRGLDVWGNCNE